jgi:hypothetical protein
MTLTDALDAVYGHGNWINPLHPFMFKQDHLKTPIEAYRELKPEFQQIVVRLIGHIPTEGEE